MAGLFDKQEKEHLYLVQKHLKVTLVVTPSPMKDEKLFSMVGEGGSMDMVMVAMTVHSFDLVT